MVEQLKEIYVEDSQTTLIRSFIRQISHQNKKVVMLACRQRAKFEGWLKFELSAILVHMKTSLQ